MVRISHGCVVGEDAVHRCNESGLLTALPVIGDAVGNCIHWVASGDIRSQVHRAPRVVARQTDLDFGQRTNLVRSGFLRRVIRGDVFSVVVQILVRRFVEGYTRTSKVRIEDSVADNSAGTNQA